MSSTRTLLLIAASLILTMTLSAQTIAPPPTSAGYPFWITPYAGKITRGKDGNIWSLTAGHVQRLTIKTGAIKSWAVDVNPDGSASTPEAIYWGTDNKVWFGTFSGKVGRLDPSTGSVTKWQLPENPVFDITTGPDGNMWASAGSSVYRITTAGAYTRFSLPFTSSMLRSGPDGFMWIMQTFGHQVARMTTSGTITNVWQLAGTGWASCGPCASITAGPDGNMWFTQNNSQPVIGRITMSGQITYFPLQGKGAGDIAWGHDGGIWFTDNLGKHIGRISTSGLVTYYDPVGQDQYSRVSFLSSSPDGNIYFTGGTLDPNYSISSGIGKIVLWIPQHAIGDNIYPTHATQFSGTVGTFSDFETDSSGFFKATVKWGDGHTTTGYVSRTSTGSPNYYKVSGTHTYSSAGHYNVTVTVKEASDKWQFTMASQASVQ